MTILIPMEENEMNESTEQVVMETKAILEMMISYADDENRTAEDRLANIAILLERERDNLEFILMDC